MENRIVPQDYFTGDSQLKSRLQGKQGFICSDGGSSLAAGEKLLRLPVRESEESAANWRNLPEHRHSQPHERMENFTDFTITVVTPVHRCMTSEGIAAPADFNQYFAVEA